MRSNQTLCIDLMQRFGVDAFVRIKMTSKTEDFLLAMPARSLSFRRFHSASHTGNGCACPCLLFLQTMDAPRPLNWYHLILHLVTAADGAEEVRWHQGP